MFITDYAGNEKAKQVSVALWGQANVERFISNPGHNIAVLEDMVGFNLSTAVATNVGYYAGRSGAWKSYEDTGVSFSNVDQGGALKYIGTTTDNLEAAVMTQSTPFVIPSSAGYKLWFECVLSKETVAASSGVGTVCGLAKAASPANSFMADAGADIADGDFIGFGSFDATTGDKLDFIFKKTGGSLVTVKAGIFSPTAATAFKAGFYYDGVTITPYINGVAYTQYQISAATIAGSTFPSGVAMGVCWGVKQGTNVAKYVKNYGTYCLQQSA